VLVGRLSLSLGGTPYEVGPDDWVRMAPGLAHAVRADEPAVMLLTLLDGSTAED
jgi:quercetin dioxygenase-like cupin family protein